MPASIGVNLRVTGHCSQGGRRYMEDLFSVAYQQTEDERDLEYAFFGIYDGHGGGEAAAFAKEHLMDIIVKQRGFWSDNDDDVLRAIRNGYMLTHLNMWKELDKWPKTVAGLPSTAGTTASVAFIRRGKIYVGHVGDSAIVLGYQEEGCDGWLAKQLTLDHKPESSSEMERIQQSGGKVVAKAGVPRVVWNRPRPGHKGPINESTPVDEIPFLAVARSLGDLWSYNVHTDEFIVSPDPDVGVLAIDTSKFRCLIFGTDGLWNMMSPEEAVRTVQGTERHNEAAVVSDAEGQPRDWRNPSKSLVDAALERWSKTRMRADNTSVVTLMLDPPGPPRAAVLRSRSAARACAPPAPPPQPHTPQPAPHHSADERPAVPQNGLTIVTRYSEEEKSPEKVPLPPCATLDGRFSLGTSPPPPTSPDDIITYGDPADSCFIARLLSRTTVTNTLSNVFDVESTIEEREETTILTADDVAAPCSSHSVHSSSEAVEPNEQETREEVVAAPADPPGDVKSIQINEVSSSSPTDAPPRPRGRKPRGEAKDPSPQVSNGRALRSHDADNLQRPQTRTSNRGRLEQPVPVETPVLQRVEILKRRVPVISIVPQQVEPVSTQTAIVTEQRQPIRRPEPKLVQSDPRIKREVVVRVTRSRDLNPQQQKPTRTPVPQAREARRAPEASAARPGNGARAPGPRRSAPVPAARRERSETPDARPEHSKENLARGGTARAGCGPRAGRGRPPHRARIRRPDDCDTLSVMDDSAHLTATPGRRNRNLARRCRNDDADTEVHSTTDEREPSARSCVSVSAVTVKPRALRSRNDAEVASPRGVAVKRPARMEEHATPAKMAKIAEKGMEKVRRGAARRGVWAPALALRNRLRKRLAK